MSAVRLRPVFHGLGSFLDAKELVIPEPFESDDPIMEGFHLAPIDAVHPLATGLPHLNEADLQEHLQVLGDLRLRPAEALDEPVDGHLPLGEQSQHRPTLRLGDGVEGIERGGGPGHAGEYIPI